MAKQKAPDAAPAKETKAETKPAEGKPKAAKPAKPAFKIGQEVVVRNTRNGNTTKGRYAGLTTVEGANGDWAKINIAAKGKPAEYKLARVSQVTAA